VFLALNRYLAQASRAWAGALGESGAAAVLEHKFCLWFQVFARVDVTDEGRFTFSQSVCPCPADGFIKGLWSCLPCF